MTRDEIISAHPLMQFLTSCGYELRPAGKNFVTNACPIAFHKKFHRCVTIDPEKNLWNCNDCKRGGTVIDWVMAEKNVGAADVMRMLGDERNSSELPSNQSTNRPRRLIVETYDYTDETGELLFQCVRYLPKDFRQRRPSGNGGWIWNLRGISLVLYHLPDVVAAQTVCVTEGEKDADNLRSLGFVATCNPMGAGKWRDEYSETLRALDVVVFGDAGDEDGAGERHTAQVIQSLSGRAKSIKRVKLPDGFHDVSDYIASLPPERVAETIRKLIDKTPEVEAHSLGKADDDSTELTSFISYAADYPAPPDEAAFYGLAGDIVRRIEPHTEADRVALLVHFLVVFGNIIKRKAHAVADGAWHYLNLFCVLVGETSKGRKGTALQHTLQLFAHADEDWRKNCLASGLSSGEGVIHAVRDEIRETKPVKEKGKYTGESVDVVTDTGVTDKRLMVIESEFCSPLKVMSREGSTLSPTLRQAWDTGNLRTLTKNSPARATEAHISITGHITRQELRRLLTETESANGFGNRILWVAARRSKCLPEGGGSYGVADLIARLHPAIESAKTAGEVNRSDSARELWREVYPQLSEGKLGLLGAITARAEAQVLRLSCIYALLDLSVVVRVEHLKAALAVWDYCERSAQWIFQTGTGNKNADRILAALKVAGTKGLTKRQITDDVFNRNATKFDLDEALRLLHHQALAICVIEKTAGRSAERWVLAPRTHEVNEVSPTQHPQTPLSSFTSSTPAQKSAPADPDSPDADKVGETVIGDELGVARL